MLTLVVSDYVRQLQAGADKGIKRLPRGFTTELSKRGENGFDRIIALERFDGPGPDIGSYLNLAKMANTSWVQVLCWTRILQDLMLVRDGITLHMSGLPQDLRRTVICPNPEEGFHDGAALAAGNGCALCGGRGSVDIVSDWRGLINRCDRLWTEMIRIMKPAV